MRIPPKNFIKEPQLIWHVLLAFFEKCADMGKYRVEFENKEIRSIRPTSQNAPENDAFLEETTGEKLWAVIDANDDNEAQEKARRLATELRTGKTKRDLRAEGDPNRERD